MLSLTPVYIGLKAWRTIHQHHIPLPHPLLPQHPSQHLDFLEQLLVRISLFAARDGRVPDDSGSIAIAALDMSVDAVVGGGNLAVREPGGAGVRHAVGELAGRGAESARGLLVPVELGGLVGPEGFGVAEGEGLDLVLEVGGHGGGGAGEGQAGVVGAVAQFESWCQPPELKHGKAVSEL